MLVLSYNSSNQTYKVAQAAGQGKGVKINDVGLDYLNSANYSLYLMGDTYRKNAVSDYEEKFEAGRMR